MDSIARTMTEMSSTLTGALSSKGSLDLRAKIRRDLRVDPEPRLPRRPHLVQQHTEAIHGGIAAPARSGEQWRVQRRVDDIRDDRTARQRVEREFERRLADHPLARRVDEQGRAFE